MHIYTKGKLRRKYIMMSESKLSLKVMKMRKTKKAQQAAQWMSHQEQRGHQVLRKENCQRNSGIVDEEKNKHKE